MCEPALWQHITVVLLWVCVCVALPRKLPNTLLDLVAPPILCFSSSVVSCLLFLSRQASSPLLPPRRPRAPSSISPSRLRAKTLTSRVSIAPFSSDPRPPPCSWLHGNAHTRTTRCTKCLVSGVRSSVRPQALPLPVPEGAAAALAAAASAAAASAAADTRPTGYTSPPSPNRHVTRRASTPRTSCTERSGSLRSPTSVRRSSSCGTLRTCSCVRTRWSACSRLETPSSPRGPPGRS